MAESKQCPDPWPHKPHIWYGPSSDPRKTGQVQYSCPGVRKGR
jgi:hypothetical protein